MKKWCVHDDPKSGKVVLYSDDFRYDTTLLLQGDFSNHAEKVAYAEALVERLEMSRVKCNVCGRWKSVKSFAQILLSGGICKKCSQEKLSENT